MRIIRTENSIHTRSRSFLYFAIIFLVISALFLFQRWYPDQNQENQALITDQEATEDMRSPEIDFAFMIGDQPAGPWVAASDITMPEDFWLTIYEIREGDYGNILGAARVRQGTATTSIRLLRPMVSGQSYAGVVHLDDGDIEFDYTRDVPLEHDGSRITREFRAL